jgi:Ferritin-like domain
MGPSDLSRRELLVLGGAGSLVAATATPAVAGPLSGSAAPTFTLAIELLVVFAYQHIIEGSTLAADSESLAREILLHHRAHVSRLTTEVGRLGAAPPQPPASVTEADKQLAARHSSGTLADLHTETDSLKLLYDVESIAVGAYYEALPKLSDPALLGTFAQIMAAEAQHTVAIGALIHPGDVRRVVPDALVSGKR